MIALDTNVLVYAHRSELERHADASTVLRSLTEGSQPFAVPVFVLVEFMRVVTHPRYFSPPSSARQATAFLDAVLGSPACRMLVPGPGFWHRFRDLMSEHRLRGNDVYDVQIGALCQEHRVRRVVTEDRAFGRLTRLSTLRLSDVRDDLEPA